MAASAVDNTGENNPINSPMVNPFRLTYLVKGGGGGGGPVFDRFQRYVEIV